MSSCPEGGLCWSCRLSAEHLPCSTLLSDGTGILQMTFPGLPSLQLASGSILLTGGTDRRSVKGKEVSCFTLGVSQRPRSDKNVLFGAVGRQRVAAGWCSGMGYVILDSKAFLSFRLSIADKSGIWLADPELTMAASTTQQPAQARALQVGGPAASDVWLESFSLPLGPPFHFAVLALLRLLEPISYIKVPLSEIPRVVSVSE